MVPSSILAPPDTARPVTSIVLRRRMRAEFQFLLLDGVATLRPAIHVSLWASRGRPARPAPFRSEVAALHGDLATVARYALPPAPEDVSVDLLPVEAAMFEREPGKDEVRLRVWVVALDATAVRSWAQALWSNLRVIGAKVEPSAWPRA